MSTATSEVLSTQEQAIVDGSKVLVGTATDRVLRILHAVRSYGPPRVALERAVHFTESFKATEGQPLVLRMAGIEGSIGMLEALRRRARAGGSYLVRVSLARNCHWVQDFGLFSENETRGAGLPASMMTAPGLQARIRPEFDLPLVTATGPLGEVSVVAPQVELSEVKLGPRFSGDPNGASKLDWSVFTQAAPELSAAELG